MKLTFYGALIFSSATLATIFMLYPGHRGPQREITNVEQPFPDAVFTSELDTQLGEQYEDGNFIDEKTYITHVVHSFHNLQMNVMLKNGVKHMSRGAHGKSIACLKGQFEVHNENLPENLRVGLFAENGRQYKAFIRMSNSDPDPNKTARDHLTRGFAIKLLGVDGEKLVDVELNPQTHDLLMVTSEGFITKDNKNYPDIVEGKESRATTAFRLGFRKITALLRSVFKTKTENNPLRLNYFSSVPYRLGPKSGPKAAIRFMLALCDKQDIGKFSSNGDGTNFLERNISESIIFAEKICLDFKIQVQGTEDDVEDATTPWTTPYQSVAKLWLTKNANPVETMATREPFCEQLSFNPWHATELHRPLGRINRARRAAYLASSFFRRQANAIVPAEPSEQTYDDLR